MSAELEALRRELLALKSDVKKLRLENDTLRQGGTKKQAPGEAAASGSDGDRRKSPAERRGGARRRTRLDSCKILTPKFEFVTESALLDQSETGCRLRLLDRNRIPSDLLLVRGGDGLLMHGHVRWREGLELGILITRTIARSDPAYPADKLSGLQSWSEKRFAFNRDRL